MYIGGIGLYDPVVTAGNPTLVSIKMYRRWPERKNGSGYLLFYNRRCGSGPQLGRRPVALTTDDPGDLCSAKHTTA